MLFAAVGASVVIVPAMEYFDGRLDGVPVRRLSEAFGGSILVGLGTTLVCATLVTLLVYAVARWLISHRDSIATIIETLLGRTRGSRPPELLQPGRATRYSPAAAFAQRAASLQTRTSCD